MNYEESKRYSFKLTDSEFGFNCGIPVNVLVDLIADRVIEKFKNVSIVDDDDDELEYHKKYGGDK